MNAYLEVLGARKEEHLLSTAYSEILKEYRRRASTTVRDPEEAPTETICEQGGTQNGSYLPQKRTPSDLEKSPSKRRCDGRNEQACQLNIQQGDGHIPSETVQGTYRELCRAPQLMLLTY